MDRSERAVKDLEKALMRLEEAYTKMRSSKGSEDYTFYRDSVIQRFEFTFEIMWKAIKEFLRREGITCRSPRSCIRELFSAGYISEDLTRKLLRMVEDRNLTVHTYREEIAEEIANRMGENILAVKELLKAIRTHEDFT